MKLDRFYVNPGLDKVCAEVEATLPADELSPAWVHFRQAREYRRREQGWQKALVIIYLPFGLLALILLPFQLRHTLPIEIEGNFMLFSVAALSVFAFFTLSLSSRAIKEFMACKECIGQGQKVAG